MTSLSQHRLFLFFTRDNGLFTWQAVGTIDREARTYKEFLPHLAGIDFVTYGNRKDLDLTKDMGRIGVRCNQYNLHPRIYTPLLAHWLPRFWPGPAIFKSNQVNGAEVMLSAARHTGAKTITRAGFLPSNIAAWTDGYGSPAAKHFRNLENQVFNGADRAVVTTQAIAQTLLEQYNVDPAKLRVVPNYVDTELFKPGSKPRPANRLCYVGRLHEEKNLDALFDAIKGVDVRLSLIGEGPSREHLEDRVRKEDLPVEFLGRIPNPDLPDQLNSSTAFIFPSLGEHHPKSLIEAMSSGLPVIACQVPGVKDLVVHAKTGWLSDTSAAGLRHAIEEVLANDDLRVSLGREARKYCIEHFSLERVVGLELEVFRGLAE
jgi:glycosyltransferase involved in cell wall biosynthesis